jgi:hypothetical protein
VDFFDVVQERKKAVITAQEKIFMQLFIVYLLLE